MGPVHQLLEDAPERVGSSRDAPVFPDMVGGLDGQGLDADVGPVSTSQEFKPITRASLSAWVLEVTAIST